MPDNLSFGKIFNNLDKAIGVTQKRNAVIASNISNIDTPKYRPKDINFKEALARTLETDNELKLNRTNSGHMDIEMNPQGIETFEEKGEWNGYNWVNIDKEMTKLTENNLIYREAVETLLRKIALIKEVIKEGGR
ncbi:MAG: flagellar basal body rod protein FlgB [Deltaproteobacteria bacterium]|nr:flagellar basal body rod protein FlgB [Deltaproteobacteria bacterium]MBW2246742.1 flagellar basal body rod protein FlgB [Deltaproteobacteria bacterium]MBW2639971.1 flagellar basal body rod protein FlgB [Deltaproteobacteria bacterium]